MIASALKLMLCTLLLDHISANSLCGNETRIILFTGGYQYYENVGFYKLYSHPSTWGHAWKQCREDGGHLVIIDSDEEHDVVWGIVKQSNTDTFIGVHDLFVEGLFVTVKGDLLFPSTYNKWYKDEPNNSQEQDCILLEKNGEIWDGNCNDKFNFICEFEIHE